MQMVGEAKYQLGKQWPQKNGSKSKNLHKASCYKNKFYNISTSRRGKAKNNFLPQRQEQVFRLWFQQTERKTEVPMM